MINSSWKVATLFGIDIKIHWTFILILGIAFMDSGGLNSDLTKFGISLIFILGIFVCVVAHEFGHIFAAKRFGIGTKQILLLPIGGVAQLNEGPKKPKDELIIALAGPLVNLIISSIIALSVWLISGRIFINRDIETLNDYFVYLGIVNMFMLLFNLIPAFPMDGGRVFRALLNFKLDRYKSTLIAVRVGQVIAIGGSIVGYYFTKNSLLFFTAMYLINAAQSELQFTKYEFLKEKITIADLITTDYKSFSINNTVEDVFDSGVLNQDNQTALVINNFQCEGILNSNEMEDIKNSTSNLKTRISNFMKIDYPRLTGQENPDHILDLMVKNNLEILPVSAGSFIDGVVYRKTLDNLLHS